MKKEERIHDRAIEKLVAKELREQLLPQAEDCPDAETLAAYVDGTLAARELRQWEGHFVRCSRCQEQVATLAQWNEGEEPLEQPAPARTRTFAPFRWAWAAPLLLTAVVAGLWYGGEFRNLLRQAQEPQVQAPSPTPSATIQAPIETPNGATTPGEAAKAQDSFKAQRAPLESTEGESYIQALATSAAAEATAKAESSPAKRAVPITSTPIPESDQPAPTIGMLADVYPRSKTLPRTGRGGESAPASGKVAETNSLAPPLALATMERKAEAVPSQRISTARGVAQESFPAAHPESWRVGPRGLIQRKDASGDWLTVPGGVEVDLYDIAFPTPDVGWVVGQNGIILRTTDAGKTWKRIATPTNEDLIRVAASSARAAHIETRIGQLWLTVDGGESWVKPFPE